MSSFKDISLNEEQDLSKKAEPMKFKVEILNKDWEPAKINLSQLALNGAYLSTSKQSLINETLIISQTVTKLDKRRIYLRSSVQIVNTMKFTIEISYPISSDQKGADYDNSIESSNWEHSLIRPGKKWCVPLDTVSQTKSSYIKIRPVIEKSNFTLEKQIINWASSAPHKLLSFDERYFIQVLINRDPINIVNHVFNRVDFIYNILLLPTITFYNYLPYPVSYQVANDKMHEKMCLHPGESAKVENARIGSSLIFEMENYAKSTWYSSHAIEINETPQSSKKPGNKIEETNIIEFRSKDAKIITFVYNCVLEDHCLSFSLYAPYWLLNQTKLKLEYKFKGSNDEVNEIDDETHELPQFLKINSKIFTSQKKSISIKVKCANGDTSEWSESFLIDAVGNSGTIISKCREKQSEKYCEIGVDIHLSSTGLTKIIKLTPYYLLVNNTGFVLDVMEVTSLNEKTPFSFSLMPNTITPFWQKHYQVKQKNSLKFRPIKDSNANILFSAPVW